MLADVLLGDRQGERAVALLLRAVRVRHVKRRRPGDVLAVRVDGDGGRRILHVGRIVGRDVRIERVRIEALAVLERAAAEGNGRVLRLVRIEGRRMHHGHRTAIDLRTLRMTRFAEIEVTRADLAKLHIRTSGIPVLDIAHAERQPVVSLRAVRRADFHHRRGIRIVEADVALVGIRPLRVKRTEGERPFREVRLHVAGLNAGDLIAGRRGDRRRIGQHETIDVDAVEDERAREGALIIVEDDGLRGTRPVTRREADLAIARERAGERQVKGAAAQNARFESVCGSDEFHRHRNRRLGGRHEVDIRPAESERTRAGERLRLEDVLLVVGGGEKNAIVEDKPVDDIGIRQVHGRRRVEGRRITGLRIGCAARPLGRIAPVSGRSAVPRIIRRPNAARKRHGNRKHQLLHAHPFLSR